MPRRTRLRTERRLTALEFALRAQPTVPLSILPTDEQAIEVLVVLERALGERELPPWLAKRLGTAPAWLTASDPDEPEPLDEPPGDDAEA